MIDRTKSYYTEQHNIIIPSNRQFLNITCGERGSGKSATQELLLETLFEKGWTVFDRGVDATPDAMDRHGPEQKLEAGQRYFVIPKGSTVADYAHQLIPVAKLRNNGIEYDLLRFTVLNDGVFLEESKNVFSYQDFFDLIKNMPTQP